jgi:hypothetical protein
MMLLQRLITNGDFWSRLTMADRHRARRIRPEGHPVKLNLFAGEGL